MYVYIGIRIHVSLDIWIHVFTCIRIYGDMDTWSHVYTDTRMPVYMSIRKYVCMEIRIFGAEIAVDGGAAYICIYVYFSGCSLRQVVI